MYLNDVNMFQYSLFCNAVVFAEEIPQVTITGLEVDKDEVEVAVSGTAKVKVSTVPPQANYPTIEVASSDSDVATASITGREITITGVAAGSGVDGEATITVSAGNVTKTISVTVPYEA